MSKKKAELPTGNKPTVYAFPSFFGSHTSMIDAEETAKLDNPKLVALNDEHGLYVTERNRLDNGCADPNRYVESRLKKLWE